MSNQQYKDARDKSSEKRHDVFMRHWLFNKERKEAILKDPKVGKSYRRHYKMSAHGGTSAKSQALAGRNGQKRSQLELDIQAKSLARHRAREEANKDKPKQGGSPGWTRMRR